MRILIALWILLTLAEPASAMTCTNETIFMPDGRVVFCTICCQDGNCTRTCL